MRLLLVDVHLSGLFDISPMSGVCPKGCFQLLDVVSVQLQYLQLQNRRMCTFRRKCAIPIDVNELFPEFQQKSTLRFTSLDILQYGRQKRIIEYELSLKRGAAI